MKVFGVSIQSISNQGKLNYCWGSGFVLFFFPRIPYSTFPGGCTCLELFAVSHQGGLRNNQDFLMENCAVGRFPAAQVARNATKIPVFDSTAE